MAVGSESSSSIKIPKELKKQIGRYDLQITDMYPSKMAMPDNQHKKVTFLGWCNEECKRIGDGAYTLECNHNNVDYICLMRKVGNV